MSNTGDIFPGDLLILNPSIELEQSLNLLIKNTDKLKKLSIDFYDRENVIEIAKELLGKILVTNFDGVETSGRIVETEAYKGITDKASHSYNGKRTARNEHMYSHAGSVYVYVCYGIHQMFNIVTNREGMPDAILIRAVEPISGINTMLERTGKNKPDFTITRGPGNVGKAFGMHKTHSGNHLFDNRIFIASDGSHLSEKEIGSSGRIGVAYAGQDALLPYRFYIRGNKYVSGKPNK